MPAEFWLMHVGYGVNDFAAISCLGAGLAAIVLTLLPGKKLTGKTDASDPSAFIDPGAGETARYRLAYGDLVTVKNTGVEATQITGKAPQPADGGDGTRVQSASELAMTMFDQGVLGVGLGARSQEATKAFSKAKVEKAKSDSKTKIEPKAKIDTKTKVDSKTKIDSNTKVEKAKPEKKADKKQSGKKGDLTQLESNMAVRKITYGHKKFESHKEGDEDPELGTAEPDFPGEVEAPVSGLSEVSFFKDEVIAAFTSSPDESSATASTPVRSGEAPGFPAQTNQAPGFPAQTDQPPGFPAQTNQVQGFPSQTNQPPGFPAQTSEPPFPQGAQQQQQEQPEQPEVDPKKDPKKVGRSTLIEPKSNLQGDREPPPPEYFK